MVVLVPRPPSTDRPPLYGILHHEGDAIATLRVEEYSWWTLGRTCVHSIVGLTHKDLEGKYCRTLAEAAQLVHSKICGGHTDIMRSVYLYVRGDLASQIQGVVRDTRIFAHEPLARAHVNSRVQSYPSEVGGGRWLPLGAGRPYIPHTMSASDALNPSVWASYRPPPASSSQGPPAPGENLDIMPHELRRRRPKKKQNRKPCLELGALVWEGDATSAAPVALVVCDKKDDPGDVTRVWSTQIEVESLEPKRRRFWKNVLEVFNFDQHLHRIYKERRPLLEALGKWDETVDAVKRAVLHRVGQSTTAQSVGEVWVRWCGMGDEPCPVTDEEAAEWLLSSGSTVKGTASTADRRDNALPPPQPTRLEAPPPGLPSAPQIDGRRDNALPPPQPMIAPQIALPLKKRRTGESAIAPDRSPGGHGRRRQTNLAPRVGDTVEGGLQVDTISVGKDGVISDYEKYRNDPIGIIAAGATGNGGEDGRDPMRVRQFERS